MLTLSYYPVLKIGVQRVSAKLKSCKVILTRSILYKQQLKCLRLVYFEYRIFKGFFSEHKFDLRITLRIGFIHTVIKLR